jgi:hypothetical protein
MTRRWRPARRWSSFRTADGAGFPIVAGSSPGMASRFALRECAHSIPSSSLRKQGPMLRPCGVSSTLWPIASIIRVSGILDRPPERAMTVSAVIPGRCEASNPESRDSGSGPSDHPGMTESQLSVASLLTKPRVWRASIPDTTSRPRGAMRPSRAFISRPKRAWGMPDARCTRGLVCACSGRKHTSNNEHTGITRHSRTQWF